MIQSEKVMGGRGSSSSDSSSRAQRNKKEKHRRMHMKALITQLASLMPSNSKLSMPEILDEARSYIMHLQKNQESLKGKKALLKGEDRNKTQGGSSSSRILPRMSITTSDSTLELNLICGINRNFMLHEIISVLEEEATQIINVNQVTSGDQVIFSIKSKAINSRIGIETSRIQQRLEELLL